ncbi:MAG: GtrA family protein [Candidatus Sungbacteria bacterium]|uniref:GtrA family protein n=1 Tax=Candidatus Sungiibacteriota bacterium TaxID=2750080 RepID=A0A933DRJ4_9BACT|nr:GtrA family protein [Candidatus Sungbacteria bacterium]
MPTLKRTDVIISLVIGEVAALLMFAVGRNLDLPSGFARLLPWLPFTFPLFTLAVISGGAWLGQYRFGFYQLAKFGLVGGLNFLIDLGALNLLLAVAGVTVGFYAVASKAAAFLAALASSFLWNKFWTFRSLSTTDIGPQFAGFFAVTIGGLIINVGVFAFLSGTVGPRGGIDARTWANVSAAGAAVVGLAWNFLGYKMVVFRKGQK